MFLISGTVKLGPKLEMLLVGENIEKQFGDRVRDVQNIGEWIDSKIRFLS